MGNRGWGTHLSSQIRQTDPPGGEHGGGKCRCPLQGRAPSAQQPEGTVPGVGRPPSRPLLPTPRSSGMSWLLPTGGREQECDPLVPCGLCRLPWGKPGCGAALGTAAPALSSCSPRGSPPCTSASPPGGPADPRPLLAASLSASEEKPTQGRFQDSHESRGEPLGTLVWHLGGVPAAVFPAG